MMELIQYIGQDVEHFIGTLAIIMGVSFGFAMIVVSVGFAIVIARGHGCACEEGGEHDHD